MSQSYGDPENTQKACDRCGNLFPCDEAFHRFEDYTDAICEACFDKFMAEAPEGTPIEEEFSQEPISAAGKVLKDLAGMSVADYLVRHGLSEQGAKLVDQIVNSYNSVNRS